MTDLRTTLDLPIMGRELPRAQRWLDSADVEAARDDPGFTQLAYLAWQRDTDAGDPADLDWDTDPEPDPTEVQAEIRPWAPAPDSLAPDVWVNGLPLDEWLAIDAKPQVAEPLATDAPPAVHGDNASRRYRLWLWRAIDAEDLGWGPGFQGARRWHSPHKWRHSTHSNLRAHEVDQISVRRQDRQARRADRLHDLVLEVMHATLDALARA